MKELSDLGSFERYRLAVISSWPESEVQRAALASARAALERETAFAQSRRAMANPTAFTAGVATPLR